MTPAKIQRVVRRLTLLLAAAGGLYLYTRFSLLAVPREGCTPVLRFAPGTTLLLDTRPRPLRPADEVLFRVDETTNSLGIVREVREDGALWIAIDASNCPAPSSEQLGWIPASRIAARVVFPLGW